LKFSFFQVHFEYPYSYAVWCTDVTSTCAASARVGVAAKFALQSEFIVFTITT